MKNVTKKKEGDKGRLITDRMDKLKGEGRISDDFADGLGSEMASVISNFEEGFSEMEAFISSMESVYPESVGKIKRAMARKEAIDSHIKNQENEEVGFRNKKTEDRVAPSSLDEIMKRQSEIDKKEERKGKKRSKIEDNVYKVDFSGGFNK